MRPSFNQWDKMLERRLLQAKARGEELSNCDIANWKYQVRQHALTMRPRQAQRPKFIPVYRSGINGVSSVVTNEGETLFVLSGSAFNRKPMDAEDMLKRAAQMKRKMDAEAWIKAITGEDKPPVEHAFSYRSRHKANDKIQQALASFGDDAIFLTLTFIQDLDHQLAVRLLNKYLNQIRKDFSGVEYIWVAELQEDNNDRIHFHLLVNKFLPVERYNSLWVLMQYNSGLVGHRSEKNGGSMIEKWEIECAHRAGITHRLLSPATMIRAYDEQGMASYLAAYLDSQPEGVKFGCRPWHCSRGVSELFLKQLEEPETFKKMCNPKYNKYVSRETGEITPIRPTHKQFCSNIYVHHKKAIKPYIRMVTQTNKWIMEGRRKRAVKQREEQQIRKGWKREDMMIFIAMASARGENWERMAEIVTSAIEADRKRQLEKHYKDCKPLITGRDDIPQISGGLYRRLYLKDHPGIPMPYEPPVKGPELPERRATALRPKKFSLEDWETFAKKYFHEN